ncbi:MAG: alginate lyase family protein [Candidatus Manganitrophaceae bacterium]
MGARSEAHDLKWMVRRLQVMGPAEIIHRVGEQCALKVMQIRHRLGREAGVGAVAPIDRFEFCNAKTPRLPVFPWKRPTDPRQMEEILDGKIRIGEWTWQWRRDDMVWHEAPDTGRVWPRRFFGSIPYRPGNRCGDIRLSWEPSRLQQLVALGLLAKERSGEVRRRAIVLLEAQFLSWVDANPHLTGVHYISAMECALRLIAVCHALDLVRGDLPHPEWVWPAAIRLIEQHARLIEKRLSLHSSAGNHTLAEAAGLVYAGVLFPEMRRAARWRSTGLSLLEQEADRQILPDGGGAEQAFGYLNFAVDLYGLVTALLKYRLITTISERRNKSVSSALQEAHRRGRQFLNSIADSEGKIPPVGDGDDGSALSPLLRLSSSGGAPKEGLTSFIGSGYSLIRSGRSFFLFDHGPLGMAPLCGHGHADALSITLRIGARAFLIDPGAFSYADLQWRAYFRGTAAHNTVTVDRQDQAVQEAPFIWSQPFQAACVDQASFSDGGIRLLAFHTGYARLGVTHCRALLFHPPGYGLIWDFLSGTGRHLLDLHWHLGVPPVEVEEGGRFLLSDAGERVSLSIEGGKVSLHRGETEPILGWRSPVYGRREPITTIRARYEGGLPHAFFTRITMGAAAPADFPPADFPNEADLAPLMKWIS